MQFKVPQDVQRADRIIGPLTLPQFLISLAGGIVAYAIYVTLAKIYPIIIWLPPVAIITLVTAAFAFARPLSMSFTKYLLRRIEFGLLPRKRIWIKASGEIPPGSIPKIDPNKAKKEKTDEETKEDALLEKQQKMKELDKFLKSQNNHK